MAKAEEHIDEQKKQLRSCVLKIRDSIGSTKRYEWNVSITDMVLNSIEYVGASVILLYAGFKSEVYTDALIEQALADCKRVFLPRVNSNDMEFYQIKSMYELEEGYRHIREPKTSLSLSEWLCSDEYMAMNKKKKQRILMLMPGAVFDQNGHRIGYGKGYYDRYIDFLLKKQPEVSLYKMALAYKCQILDCIPATEFDIAVDEIMCEEGRIIG